MAAPVLVLQHKYPHDDYSRVSQIGETLSSLCRSSYNTQTYMDYFSFRKLYDCISSDQKVVVQISDDWSRQQRSLRTYNFSTFAICCYGRIWYDSCRDPGCWTKWCWVIQRLEKWRHLGHFWSEMISGKCQIKASHFVNLKWVKKSRKSLLS